jgi:hypothetical protein
LEGKSFGKDDDHDETDAADAAKVAKKKTGQHKEKRRKALPVKKLLELERGVVAAGGNTGSAKEDSSPPLLPVVPEVGRAETPGSVVTAGRTSFLAGGGSILGSLEKMVESSFGEDRSPASIAAASRSGAIMNPAAAAAASLLLGRPAAATSVTHPWRAFLLDEDDLTSAAKETDAAGATPPAAAGATVSSAAAVSKFLKYTELAKQLSSR